MFHIEGIEFAELFKREFAGQFITNESSGILEGKFACHAKNFSEESFDILNFTGHFQDDVQVNNFRDVTHVSLHFQLSGSSSARISGINKDLPICSGNFNLFNCVDPISTFQFPKQQEYEYICVGLKPAFFGQMLTEFDIPDDEILSQTKNSIPFSLFSTSRLIHYLQHNAIQLIQSPPVADTLKIPYIKSKIKELTILTLGEYAQSKILFPEKLSKSDTEKLYNVKNWLLTNFLGSLTLESISKEFMLNEFKLKSGFKKLFGMTVFGHIQQLRMEHAFTLVSSGGFTVGEVAAIIGYTSDSAFIRSFKQYFGYPPGKMLIR